MFRLDCLRSHSKRRPSDRRAPSRTLLFAGILLLAHLPPATAADDNSTLRQKSAGPQTGLASYYAHKYHGKPTASGELFDMHQLTAAHPTLPFGTLVRVTHLANRRSVVVRINDRGPFVTDRIIDLSLAAAQDLQMLTNGLARVRIEVLPKPPRRS